MGGSICNRGCDVLIVGGGPAGLAAAIALRQRGADVLLADGQTAPIDKACGEGLMPDARRELERLGVELRAGDGAGTGAETGAEFRGIAFVSEAGRVAAAFPRGAGIGVRRPVLQARLVERAAELGVRMRWATPVALKDGQAAALEAEPCAYRWLVGADGQRSRVRSWAGLDAGRERSRRFGFRAHFRVRPWSEFVEIHWGALGQAYVTPVGAEEISVSVMTRHPGVRVEPVLDGVPLLREKLAGAERTTTERGSLTVTRRLQRVTREFQRVTRGGVERGVALIGDASGSVDAITGEGMALGFRQAQLLAESLAAGGLELYERSHAETLALPQRMAGVMLLMDRFPALRRRALRVLAARPELFRGLLAVHVGEQALPGFVWRHGAELTALLMAPGLA